MASLVAVLGAAAAIVAWTLAAPQTAPAADASTGLLQAQTLYLTERFTQDGPKVQHDASTPPEQLVVLRGEREGFQAAFMNTAGGELRLGAHIANADGALAGQLQSGQIGFEIVRVGFVDLPKGSSKLRGRRAVDTPGGRYADPLPPIVNTSEAGKLHVAHGQWGGVAVIAKVRTDAAPGSYSANLELFTGDGGPNSTTYVRVPFTLQVANTTMLQPGNSLGKGKKKLESFKTVINVEGETYWLQHKDMRDRPRGTELWADRTLQIVGLMNFLDSRNVTPLSMPFGNPSPTGAYTCTYRGKNVAPQSFLSQLKDRYFAGGRDVDPGTPKFPARMAPTETVGCTPVSGNTTGFHGTVDKYRTTSVKQDDFFNPKAPAFFRNVNNTWRSNGLFRAGATYVKSPFDEPGEASKRQRDTHSREVPKANVALRQAFGGRAKVVLSAWPRDNRGKKVCRKFGKGQRCTNLTGDGFDNRKLWDGRGRDDVDVWMPHFSRLYGRTTPAKVARDYKVNRTRDYANRLASIRKKKVGNETWAYNFYTATNTMPQVTIDAPGTDPRLQYLMLAKDGHTGLFISNMMMGWGGKVEMQPGTNVRRKGDPYEQALYFKHPVYGIAAGWGTFIYPGYRPELGLDGEARRNTAAAEPVSSLRLEALRDGTEDANLIQTYRHKFGEAKLQAKLNRIFPKNRVVNYPATLGNVVGPKYVNNNTLAMRMEQIRREMIAELG